MGQKINPLGFRLGITQKHRSEWYCSWGKYSTLLEEDNNIRTFINKKFKKIASISNIEIHRNGFGDNIEVIIKSGRPGNLVGENGSVIKNLGRDLKAKILPSQRQININILEIKNTNSEAPLLSEFVCEQLEDRVAYRRSMREGLQCIQDEEVNGVKIKIGGRLNGAEMARKEWIREGRIPLQTLRADIDYHSNEANTIYGVLGVKVWLYRSEYL